MPAWMLYGRRHSVRRGDPTYQIERALVLQPRGLLVAELLVDPALQKEQFGRGARVARARRLSRISDVLAVRGGLDEVVERLPILALCEGDFSSCSMVGRIGVVQRGEERRSRLDSTESGQRLDLAEHGPRASASRSKFDQCLLGPLQV